MAGEVDVDPSWCAVAFLELGVDETARGRSSPEITAVRAADRKPLGSSVEVHRLAFVDDTRAALSSRWAFSSPAYACAGEVDVVADVDGLLDLGDPFVVAEAGVVEPTEILLERTRMTAVAGTPLPGDTLPIQRSSPPMIGA